MLSGLLSLTSTNTNIGIAGLNQQARLLSVTEHRRKVVASYARVVIAAELQSCRASLPTLDKGTYG